MSSGDSSETQSQSQIEGSAKRERPAEADGDNQPFKKSKTRDSAKHEAVNQSNTELGQAAKNIRNQTSSDKPIDPILQNDITQFGKKEFEIVPIIQKAWAYYDGVPVVTLKNEANRKWYCYISASNCNPDNFIIRLLDSSSKEIGRITAVSCMLDGRWKLDLSDFKRAINERRISHKSLSLFQIQVHIKGREDHRQTMFFYRALVPIPRDKHSKHSTTTKRIHGSRGSNSTGDTPAPSVANPVRQDDAQTNSGQQITFEVLSKHGAMLPPTIQLNTPTQSMPVPPPGMRYILIPDSLFSNDKPPSFTTTPQTSQAEQSQLYKNLQLLAGSMPVANLLMQSQQPRTNSGQGNLGPMSQFLLNNLRQTGSQQLPFAPNAPFPMSFPDRNPGDISHHPQLHNPQQPHNQQLPRFTPQNNPYSGILPQMPFNMAQQPGLRGPAQQGPQGQSQLRPPYTQLGSPHPPQHQPPKQ